MADKDEIYEAIDAAKSSGCKDLAILHCVSGYPAPIKDYNLKTIIDMKKEFDVTVGISDHTITNTTSIAAISLGASIVEKHITLDRNGGGPDDTFSLEYSDLKNLCIEAKEAWKSIGEINYGLKSSEKGNIKFRRSLYFIRDLKAGSKISKDDIRSVRPGYGVSPKNYDSIIGKELKESVQKNTPVSFDILN